MCACYTPPLIFTWWTSCCSQTQGSVCLITSEVLLADHMNCQIWPFPPTHPQSNYMAEYLNFRSNNISMLVSLSQSCTYITYFISYLFFCGDRVVLLKAIVCRIIIQGMQSLISWNEYVTRLNVHMYQLHWMDIPANTRNILIRWKCINNLGSQKFKYIFITSPTHNIYTFIVLTVWYRII